ncbi:MAG TPA: hypothetical protein VFE11_18320, partial [Dongiaceae bacterium]|nr:hypothetical protein [Dongiaceae bacterium]
ERQPHIRGGAREPLTRAEIEEKFAMCCRHSGWDDAGIDAALGLARRLFDAPIDLSALRDDRDDRGQTPRFHLSDFSQP